MGDITVMISRVYIAQKGYSHSIGFLWICYHRKLGGVFIIGEHLFERLARERGVAVEEMREIISVRIRRGMNDPDPEKRVCTPFDVVLAFFISVLIVLKFVGEYGNILATENQQAIINDVIDVKIGGYLHKT